MNRLPGLLLALLLLAVPFMARGETPSLAESWNGAEIEWRDIRSGIYASATSGRPVIMVFHAPWCSACKKYRSVFYDKDIVAASKDFVMILIDGDADKTSNGAFAPDGTYVPRTIFLDSDGNVQSHLVGTGDPKFPHSIDLNGPGELLSLMKKARETMKGFAPAETAGDRT